MTYIPDTQGLTPNEVASLNEAVPVHLYSDCHLCAANLEEVLSILRPLAAIVEQIKPKDIDLMKTVAMNPLLRRMAGH